MIKIIKPGNKKEYIKTCPKCGCEFSYELEDISYLHITCPCCKYSMQHSELDNSKEPNYCLNDDECNTLGQHPDHTIELTTATQKDKNIVAGDIPVFNIPKCPHCGASYFREGSSSTTTLNFTPIWKDGININQGRNTTTVECECLNCGKTFKIMR